MRHFSILLALILSLPVNALEIPLSSMETPVQTLISSDPAPVVACEETPKDPICSDLGAFTCAPGEYEDGTGLSQGPNSRQDKITSMMTEALPRLRTRFAEALRSPEKAYFRQIALSATGLSASPECTGSEIEKCNSRISEGLSRLSLARLFPPENSVPANPYANVGDLKDMDYLIASPDLVEVEKAEAEAIRNKLKDEAFEKRLKEVIFPDVQKHVLEVISSRITDEKLRTNLKTKLSAIKFDGSDCTEVAGMGTMGSSLNSLLVPNAYYNPLTNTFKYCNGFLLTDRSEFKIVSVIAHELGHSIDPCNITRGPSSMAFSYKSNEREAMEHENPFSEVISCLRSPQSVNAQPMTQMMGMYPGGPLPMPMPFPDPTPGATSGGIAGGGTQGASDEEITFGQETSGGIAGGGMTGGLAGGIAGGGMAGGGSFGQTPTNPLCGNSDQIGESFCDWLSTEVVPRYMNERHSELSRDQFRYGYSNVFRGMCNNLEQKGPLAFGMQDPHPPIVARTNKIFLAHPEVRRQMGCQNDPAPAPLYCGRKP